MAKPAVVCSSGRQASARAWEPERVVPALVRDADVYVELLLRMRKIVVALVINFWFFQRII
ncbi:MAG: hypothetical protein LBE74_01630 [Treponema sp.]|nr:hypothetical protein [Treponema sp.]